MWGVIRDEAERRLADDYQCCVDLLTFVEFDSKNRQHLLSVLLYCSIIEILPSLLLLIRNKRFTAIPQLVRSMYEADIDLSNSLQYKEYSDYLHASSLTGEINTLQKAL